MRPREQWVVITQAGRPEPRRRWRQDGAGLRSLRLCWELAPHPLPGGRVQVRPGEGEREGEVSPCLALVSDAALSLSVLPPQSNWRALDVDSPELYSP